jgi:hypothetical protein
MDAPAFYQITVEGHMDSRWSKWFDGFDGLRIAQMPDGNTRVSGLVQDQAALFGILEKIRDLNLTLLSVSRSDRSTTDSSATT